MNRSRTYLASAVTACTYEFVPGRPGSGGRPWRKEKARLPRVTTGLGRGERGLLAEAKPENVRCDRLETSGNGEPEGNRADDVQASDSEPTHAVTPSLVVGYKADLMANAYTAQLRHFTHTAAHHAAPPSRT